MAIRSSNTTKVLPLVILITMIGIIVAIIDSGLVRALLVVLQIALAGLLGYVATKAK